MQTLLRILFTVFFSFTATACIWDAQSLSREKSRSHDLAQTILGEITNSENTVQLRATIKDLEANRKENDVNWWNNLAGAHLRLNQPQDAVNLLEPVVAKFPNDYGIHANLGTAYHLLGRYQDAEKEIARDLEINPDAHFGLEKYHLALLQYLVRDAKYQSRHVYVDEFTPFFLTSRSGHFDYGYPEEDILKSKAQDYNNDVARAEADYQAFVKTNQSKSKAGEMVGVIAVLDRPPAYRTNWDWNLLYDTNIEAGVIYMAQMNPKEPACLTMLGIVAWKKVNYHLAVAAFEKAIAVGSPQSELLKERVADVRQFIQDSQRQRQEMYIFLAMAVVILSLVITGSVWFFRWLARLSK